MTKGQEKREKTKGKQTHSKLDQGESSAECDDKEQGKRKIRGNGKR